MRFVNILKLLDCLISDRDPVKLQLTVNYPDDYPDVIPELKIEAIEGVLENGEEEKLLGDLQTMVRRTVIMGFIS
jgi:hypothetical protein